MPRENSSCLQNLEIIIILWYFPGLFAYLGTLGQGVIIKNFYIFNGILALSSVFYLVIPIN